MIHWLVISVINLSELKKMSLILHFFQNIHRKKIEFEKLFGIKLFAHGFSKVAVEDILQK